MGPIARTPTPETLSVQSAPSTSTDDTLPTLDSILLAHGDQDVLSASPIHDVMSSSSTSTQSPLLSRSGGVQPSMMHETSAFVPEDIAALMQDTSGYVEVEQLQALLEKMGMRGVSGFTFFRSDTHTHTHTRVAGRVVLSEYHTIVPELDICMYLFHVFSIFCVPSLPVSLP